MTETSGLINVGVRLARSGEREQALRLFEQVTAQNPAEAEAWLWISELSTSLDEQVAALDRAVECIDSSAESTRTLQERLNEIRGAQTLPAPTAQVEETPQDADDAGDSETCSDAVFLWAERLVILGEDREAKRQLDLLLEEEPHHERALMLLSELAPTRSEQAQLIQRVLEINPANAEAVQRLEALRAQDLLALNVPMKEHSGQGQKQGLFQRAMNLFSR